MSDDFPEVSTALNALPIAEPKPVDIAAIYRAALDRQATAARLWKRIACAVAALAAGVILFALVPKIEVRVTGEEFAVRWGPPSKIVVEEHLTPVPQPDSRLPSLIDDQQKQIAAMRAINLKYAEMQELLLALAVDVADRDKAQLERIAEFTGELRAFQLATVKQFDQTEKTSTTLYNAVFSTTPKTGE